MLSTVMRTAILYLTVTIAIRLMGKRQIGDLQPNELVITLLISEIAAIPLQDSNQPILNGVAAIFILIVFEILVSTLSLKSSFIRKLLNGKAVILIKDGKIDQRAMKSVRVTGDDLLEMLRSKDVFDISEVSFAVLEVNGELNVLLKSQYQNVTKKDMNLSSEAAEPFLPLVIDGSCENENLDYFNIKEKDIKKISNHEIKDVFLLLYKKGGKTTFVKKENK